MKTTIHGNTFSFRITDEKLAEIFDNVETYPHQVPTESTISLWDFSVMPSGYGHWKVSIEIDVNGTTLNLSHTTTDSISVDAYKSDDDDRSSEGFAALLESVVNANESEIETAAENN